MITKFKNWVNNSYNKGPFPSLFSVWALLTFLVTFDSYFGRGYLSSNSSQPCFPNIQSCKDIFKLVDLTPLPYGYGESFFFTILFGIIVFSGVSLYKKNYSYAHISLGLLFILKVLIVATNYGMGNYDYYDLILIGIFLFYPSRIDLVKLTFILLYFFASTIKIHEGWIAGTYFSTLFYGLPLVPEILIPLATNIVTVMQMAGCLLLLSKNKKVSDYSLYFFVFFHLYSTILVGYRYPITSLLSLVIIFLVSKDSISAKDYSFSKNNLIFYIIISTLLIGQLVPYAIKGDQKFTLEGNNYGLYMFEANHQCISSVMAPNLNINTSSFSYDARNRCDPYIYLYRLQKRYCKANRNIKISWTLDHSINGLPFKRMIDTTDLCSLTYTPLTRNSWITNEVNAKIVGLPYKNIYLANNGFDSNIISDGVYIYPKTLSFSKPVTTSKIQDLIIKQIKWFKLFYWLLWGGILLYMIHFASVSKKI